MEFGQNGAEMMLDQSPRSSCSHFATSDSRPFPSLPAAAAPPFGTLREGQGGGQRQGVPGLRGAKMTTTLPSARYTYNLEPLKKLFKKLDTQKKGKILLSAINAVREGLLNPK